MMLKECVTVVVEVVKFVLPMSFVWAMADKFLNTVLDAVTGKRVKL